MSDDQYSFYAPTAAAGPQPQSGAQPFGGAPPSAGPAPVPNPTYPPPPVGWNPGPGYPPAAPSRRRRGWIIAGVSVAVVVIALIGLAVTVFIHNTKGAKNEANDYLAAVTDGQYAAAYGMLCPQDQSAETEQQFAMSKAAVHPLSYTITGVVLISGTNGSRADVSYTRIESGGDSGEFFIPLVKTNGSWLVCHDG